MGGFGTAPFGTAPYGVGTPSTAGGNVGSVLSDAFGASQGSRRVGTKTRQYEYDANGRAKGRGNTESLVLMALTTIAGSSAQAALGDAAPSGVIGANFVARRTASIRQALGDLVKAKSVAIISIDVDVTRRPVFTLIRWRDLTTQSEQETAI